MALSAADFRPRLERLLRAFGQSAANDPQMLDRGARFAELVVAWNQRMDLTAARDPDELVDLLFADAAAIASAAPRAAGESWLDVGSGAGAPGVALALLLPSISMTLVEPRAKRVAFLRTLTHELSRYDLRVERTRSEALPAQSVEVAVSRATLPPAEWLAEGARLARSRVWVLLARSEAPELAGMRVDDTLQYDWPLTGKVRTAIAYRQERFS